mmetsp:Transcript_81511/g.264072  ORF Transcript_81511/g.264072 Transcript_81511/m.264072 type:complete len:558 (-) Transcript_81511:143-1816(-)
MTGQESSAASQSLSGKTMPIAASLLTGSSKPLPRQQDVAEKGACRLHTGGEHPFRTMGNTQVARAAGEVQVAVTSHRGLVGRAGSISQVPTVLVDLSIARLTADKLQVAGGSLAVECPCMGDSDEMRHCNGCTSCGQGSISLSVFEDSCTVGLVSVAGSSLQSTTEAPQPVSNTATKPSVAERYGALLQQEQEERRAVEERLQVERSALHRAREAHQERLRRFEEERARLLRRVHEKKQMLDFERMVLSSQIERERVTSRNEQERLWERLRQTTLCERSLLKEMSSLLLEREALKKGLGHLRTPQWTSAQAAASGAEDLAGAPWSRASGFTACNGRECRTVEPVSDLEPSAAQQVVASLSSLTQVPGPRRSASGGPPGTAARRCVERHASARQMWSTRHDLPWQMFPPETPDRGASAHYGAQSRSSRVATAQLERSSWCKADDRPATLVAPAAPREALQTSMPCPLQARRQNPAETSPHVLVPALSQQRQACQQAAVVTLASTCDGGLPAVHHLRPKESCGDQMCIDAKRTAPLRNDYVRHMLAYARRVRHAEGSHA